MRDCIQYGKYSTWLNLLLAVGLMLALGSKIAGPPYHVSAQGMGPQAAMGTAFTYQGRLLKNDTPVDGVTCDFTFDLYNVASGGAKLDTASKSAAVSDGYFSVALDFGGDAFTGEARWLEVSVQCPGDGSPVPLDDQRVALTGAPYAHSLRPGSFVDGSATGPDLGQAVLNARNTITSSGHTAVFGVSGATVPGKPGLHVGVRGEAAGGYGVTGRSTHSTGVLGRSTDGYGVSGVSTNNVGVDGQSASGYGVHARGGAGDLGLANGTIYSTLLDSSDLTLHSNDTVDVHLDDDGNSASHFRILNDADTVVFAVDESGTITGNIGGGNGWSLTGNAGTDPAVNFLGTTDNVSLTLAVNSAAALRLVPNNFSPNIIGGYSGNSVLYNVVGSVIGGGGSSFGPNRVESDYGTIGGGVGNTVTAGYGTIGGGNAISVTGGSATVSGGGYNAASGYGAVVGGGGGFDLDLGPVGNTAAGDWSVIGGGKAISVTGEAATVAGGSHITVTGDYAAVGGGHHNIASGHAATIGGGGGDVFGLPMPNTASGEWSTIGGGRSNAASGAWATIGGGQTNTVSNQSATVGGGAGNQASEIYATVGGGNDNKADGEYSTVGGGDVNEASGEESTVGGGRANVAGGENSTVSGGDINWAVGPHTSIGGGRWNAASGNAATIGGGEYISVTGQSATVSGGSHITVTAEYATVGGGGFNTASGIGAVVAGGGGEDPVLVGTLPNTASGILSVIGGGGLNTASEGYATVSGGLENNARAWGATIGGGEQITVSGSWATAAGGRLNTVDGDYSTVSGGWSNVASGDQAAIGGGWANIADGDQAAVCGGYDNEAAGDHAAIGGGYNNEATGDFATVVGGHSAEASHFGQVAHASGSFGGAGDAQGSFYVLRGTTDDDTETELFLDGGSQRITMGERTMTFDILVVARTPFPWSAGYTAQGVIEGWSGGNVGFVFGTPTIVQLGDDIGGTAFNVYAENNALVLKVTGAVDKDVRWVATVRTAEVAWPNVGASSSRAAGSGTSAGRQGDRGHSPGEETPINGPLNSHEARAPRLRDP